MRGADNIERVVPADKCARDLKSASNDVLSQASNVRLFIHLENPDNLSGICPEVVPSRRPTNLPSL
jgi:hypothetical protein